MTPIERQNKEFDAAEKFAAALRAHSMTPVVDDDYQMVRGRYESSARNLLGAFIDNRRLAPNYSAKSGPVGEILEEITKEIAFAVDKFPTWPTRLIDAGNVVSEEAGELAKACLQVTYEPHKETLAGARKEAIQTAAMAIRFLLSMDRYDCTPGPQHEQSA